MLLHSWPQLLLPLLLAPPACLVFLLVVACIRGPTREAQTEKWRRRFTQTHLLIVLGSGGHTAEMLSMLRRVDLDPRLYTFRTYIASSGDNFSAAKAVEFEEMLHARHLQRSDCPLPPSTPASLYGKDEGQCSYAVITVPRARRVHQSYLTAPFSTLACFWACLLALCGWHRDQRKILPPRIRSDPYPDLILTNGPATAVSVVLAAKLLRIGNYCYEVILSVAHKQSSSPGGRFSQRKLRTVFVESWARVTTLSLSGKLLLPVVDRFLVQWPALAGKQAWRGWGRAEYVGTIVD